MNDFRKRLADLRRPRLLITVARHGVSDHRRDRDLRRLVDARDPETAVNTLIAQEQRLEDVRRTGCASYSITRHIEVLVALMAEVRLLPRPTLTLAE